MSDKTDELRDIFLEVSDGGTVTERQREGPSRDPVEDEETELAAAVASAAREDGLEDALDGDAADADLATG